MSLRGFFGSARLTTLPGSTDVSLNSKPQRALPRQMKNVWMVHSGGFYRVEKQTVPNVIPEKLHWFKWEAALTWLTGISLFILVYYHGKIMVDFEDARIKEGMAVFWSICLIMFGWTIYDLLLSKLFLKNEMLGVGVCYVVIVGLTYGLFYYFARRAACLQLGAMLGTIMTANVWMRILPAQRRMVAALKEGKEPDQAEARRAKDAFQAQHIHCYTGCVPHAQPAFSRRLQLDYSLHHGARRLGSRKMASSCISLCSPSSPCYRLLITNH